MKSQSPTRFRLKTVAVALALTSTLVLSANAAPLSSPQAESTAVTSANLAAENRALDEKKATLVNTADSPAIPVNRPRIDPRLMEMANATQATAKSKSASGIVATRTTINGVTISAGPDEAVSGNGMVRIDLIARGDVTALQAELAAMGMKDMSSIGRNVSGEMPVESLAAGNIGQLA